MPAPSVRRPDLLRLPVLGAFLRWRYARFALQVPLLLIALLSIYDGLVGRQIPSVNVAGVSVWVHYRGLVALLLVIVGNLFCAACPLMLTRGPSKALKRIVPQLEWPKALRNKWTVLALTVVYLYTYEHFDLWASPFLTAWLIIGYFAAALVVDSLFPAGTFCKYVCPLGNFNFALSGASPTQISAKDPNVCTSCEGKYCLNGRVETATSRSPMLGHRAEHVRVDFAEHVRVDFAEHVRVDFAEHVKVDFAEHARVDFAEHVMLELPMVDANAKRTQGRFPGCETDLFVPTMTTTTDCTLCLNCVRACPYDNVALGVRSPVLEATTARPKTDWAVFVAVLAWAGLFNAFAMTPPYFAFANWLSGTLGTREEALLLAVLMIGFVGVGVGLTVLAARAANGALRDWVPTLIPLAVAAWGGHYLYHFVIGQATLWPNITAALYRLGLEIPIAKMPAAYRIDGIFPYQVAVTYVGLAATGYAIWRRASKTSLTAMLPQLALALVYVAVTLLIFAQPMQARGSLLEDARRLNQPVTAPR